MMEYKLINLGLKLSDKQLNDFGFINKTLTHKVDDDFDLVFIYKDDCLEVKAMDKSYGEEYMPFNVENNRGGISSYLHEEADNVISRLIEQSRRESVSKEELFDYIEKTFATTGDYPFEDYHAVAFRNEYKKWFVLYMQVKASSIYKNRSEETLECINIKLPEKELKESISKGIAHPAFHMNKKYWVTIVLSEVKLNDIKDLLMLSYVETGKKGYN